jgi:hypothetical protein
LRTLLEQISLTPFINSQNQTEVLNIISTRLLSPITL